MGAGNGRVLVAALAGGVLAALGAALLITLALAILGLYLSGHNLSLWGYGQLPNQPAGNWPGLLLIGGSASAGLITGSLLYRSLSARRRKLH